MVLDENVEYIKSYAFENCHSLEKINLSMSIVSVGSFAFSSAWNVKIYIDNVAAGPAWSTSWSDNTNNNIIYNTQWDIQDDGLVTFNTSLGRKYIVAYIGEESYYTIPNDIYAITAYSFINNNLTKVVVPESVVVANNYAFYDCRNLLVCCVADSRPTEYQYEWVYSCEGAYYGYDETLVRGNITIVCESVELNYIGQTYYTDEYFDYVINGDLTDESFSIYTSNDGYSSRGKYMFNLNYNIYDDVDDVTMYYNITIVPGYLIIK